MLHSTLRAPNPPLRRISTHGMARMVMNGAFQTLPASAVIGELPTLRASHPSVPLLATTSLKLRPGLRSLLSPLQQLDQPPPATPDNKRPTDHREYPGVFVAPKQRRRHPLQKPAEWPAVVSTLNHCTDDRAKDPHHDDQAQTYGPEIHDLANEPHRAEVYPLPPPRPLRSLNHVMSPTHNLAARDMASFPQ